MSARAGARSITPEEKEKLAAMDRSATVFRVRAAAWRLDQLTDGQRGEPEGEVRDFNDWWIRIAVNDLKLAAAKLEDEGGTR